MPIYDFRCPECRHEWSIKLSIEDEHPTDCPQCEHHPIKQILQSVAMRTATGFQAMERLEECAKKDRRLVDIGNDRAMSDLVGDKPNPLKSKR